MNIIYDNVIYNLQNAGGISTYWTELSKRLIRDNINVNFIERNNQNISRKELFIRNGQIFKDSNYPQIINRFIPLSLSSFKSKFIFHSSYNRVTNNLNALQVMTVHDFVHEKFYGGLRQMLHSYQKNKSLRSAQMIISVSENTKRDLLDLHPYIDPERVKVVYNGVSDDFFITDKDEINKPYLLFIGSREHYKNFGFVIKLLKELPEFDLYIVGKSLSKDEEILLAKSINGRYKIFNNVGNVELNNIYNNAFALLYPSSYEGFGIPLLEAMKTGLPFIALNRSSIPEVAGNAGLLLDELDIELFKISIQKIGDTKSELVSKGLKQADNFSWEKSYQETKNIYTDLI